MTGLSCYQNDLTCLNVKNGNNINMDLFAPYNVDLTCIEVDDPAWATTNWTVADYNIDDGVSFNTDCNYSAGCFTTPSTIAEINTIISLYPNPASNRVMIEVESYPSQLVLMDIQGKVIRQELITNKTHVMDISALGKGIYFVRIEGFSSKLIIE